MAEREVRIYNLHPSAQPPYAHTLAVAPSGRMRFPYHPGLSLKSMSEIKRMLPADRQCNCAEVAYMFLDLFTSPEKYVHKVPSGRVYLNTGISTDTPRRLGGDLFTLFVRGLALKALERREARTRRRHIEISQDAPRIQAINRSFMRMERSIRDRQDNLVKLIKFRDCSGPIKVRWIRLLMRLRVPDIDTRT